MAYARIHSDEVCLGFLFDFLSKILYHIYISRSDEIGNHARLKIVCRKAWEFKSPLRHKKHTHFFGCFLCRRVTELLPCVAFGEEGASLYGGDLKDGAMPHQRQASPGREKFFRKKIYS